MLDVDHFKSINDTHGHQGGDEVLRALAATCAACMRDRYFMGRLGGEEFACILPDTSLEQAMLIAERLRREVALKRIYLEEDAQVAITVSIGVATFHKTDSSIDTVLHRADHALYAAKQAGRDCIRSEG
jgi:diguanylate cyclase (GGDEF)-like protein